MILLPIFVIYYSLCCLTIFKDCFVARMHSVGIHSALAIKRQRKRRDEARRARERRFSVQSTESYLTSPRNSIGSLDRGTRSSRRNRPPLNPETSIGMVHIGVVFLVLGAFLLVAGLLPGDLASWGGWFNELVMTGSFALFVGIFLLVLNRIISKQEDQDLSEYVQRQLTRSKSGHRLVRDVETGCLTTIRQRDERRSSPGSSHDLSNLDDGPISPALVNSNPEIHINSPPATGAVQLEKIVEECESKETLSRDEISISTTGSPTSPCETQELLRFYPPPVNRKAIWGEAGVEDYDPYIPLDEYRALATMKTSRI